MSKLFTEYLKSIGNELNGLLERAKISSKGTTQEVADFKESAFRNSVRKMFPRQYTISKGQVLDSNDVKSLSVDVLVLSPNHPNYEFFEGKLEFNLADGVDFAIELKGGFNWKYFEEGLNQVTKVKKLNKCIIPSMLKHTNRNAIPFSRKICSVIFFEFKLPQKYDSNYIDNRIYDIYEKYIKRYYSENEVNILMMFDYIIINNLCVFHNKKIELLIYKDMMQNYYPDNAKFLLYPFIGIYEYYFNEKKEKHVQSNIAQTKYASEFLVRFLLDIN